MLPTNYKLRWSNIRDSERVRKEAGLMWRWCEVIINHLSSTRKNRESQTADLSSQTDRVAHASNAIITGGPHSRNNSYVGNTQGLRAQKLTLNWKQCIFGHRLPNRFKSISSIWLFIRGVVLWHIWEQHNEAAFDGRHWHPAKLYHKL